MRCAWGPTWWAPFTREYAVESLNFAVELAEKYGKLVDVHCDEIDDEQSRGLEVLAARAYESGLKDRVTASHTTAMHSYNNAYVTKLMRLLKLSEINFVSNPLVNTHLQGRMDTYPKRRGVTRVKELTEAGINVSFGHDAARTLHLGERFGIGAGRPASFIVLDSKNWYDALNSNAAVLYSYKNGRKIAEGVPGTSKILF